ncbi:helix-turn-helix domain-containing protein [Streptomyces sp. NPDC057242]|uniref:helix-turn-helix domain-containing protein n=1 Tax=Streptomyces sp. NPDC057242 TaxID=3346063 RepID=UPI003625BE86
MSDHVQSVRNAWINRVRDEALRTRRPEVSKAAHIGILIATYANADGSQAFPSTGTLAAIAGVSEETVTRCVRLLLAAELLVRRRRPNQSSVYQLLIPTARIDWNEHLHVWGETRQAKARRKAKADAVAALLAEQEGTPSPDAVRNPSPAGVPEPVPGGGLPIPPTCGRDPGPDQTMAAAPPQPQDAHASDADDAGLRLVPPPRGGRRAAPGDVQTAGSQRPLLLPVRGLPADRRELTRDQRDAVRAQATPELVRAAIDAEGIGQAIHLYGSRLVSEAMNDDPTSTTGT